MEIRKQACDGMLVLHVEARRIDASIAMEFKDAIIKVIDEGNHDLVIDLSQVEFLDSSGLGAIVGALKYLGHKGNLVLTGLSRSVLRVLQLTRMDKVFRIAETVDDAIACAV